MLVRSITDTGKGLIIIVVALLLNAGLNAAHQSDLAEKRKELGAIRYFLESWRHACLLSPQESAVRCYDMQHTSYQLMLGEESISYASKTQDILRRGGGITYQPTGEFDVLGQRTPEGGYEIVVNSGKAQGKLLPVANSPGSYYGTLTYPSEPGRRERLCFGPDLDLCRYVAFFGPRRVP